VRPITAHSGFLTAFAEKLWSEAAYSAETFSPKQSITIPAIRRPLFSASSRRMHPFEKKFLQSAAIKQKGRAGRPSTVSFAFGTFGDALYFYTFASQPVEIMPLFFRKSLEHNISIS